MANTTNFGWETPDDTDLVKDGAAAMRTLGNAIDTSLVDLKGGTTGQVLSKTSNTDMDFTWVTSDDANAIQNAIVDAKGDLISATAADTPARLAVGNNGEILVADSSATTGLRYSAGVGFTQPVINGGMDIWQRGTSFTATGVYTADRWFTGSNTGQTISRQTTSDTTNLPFIQYCVRASRNNGTTNTNLVGIAGSIETVNSIPFAGKTVTVSYYARAGANLSGTVTATLYSGTGTDQRRDFGAGFTGEATVVTATPTLTSTWTRYTMTGTIAATSTELAVLIYFAPAGTAGAADYIEVTGVQIDVGSTALPFRRSGGTLAGELAACQRYYWRTGGDTAYQYLEAGFANSTTSGWFPMRSPQTFRVAPTAVDYSTLAIYNGGSVLSVTNVTIQTAGKDVSNIAVTVSGATSGSSYYLITNNSTSGYLGLSAEL